MNLCKIYELLSELSLFPLLFIKSFSESSFLYILSHLILTAILKKVYLSILQMKYWGWERLSTFARFYIYSIASEGFPGGTVVEKPPASAGDTGDAGSVPGSGRSPGEGSGNPLQCSCWENFIDRGAWQAVVHAQLSTHIETHTHTPANEWLESEVNLR